MVRQPYVCGKFYPSQPEDLKDMLSSFVSQKSSKVLAKGMILPHAGYVFSGKVAAVTAAKVIPKKKIIILGPNHTGTGAPFSVYPGGAWDTPLGKVFIDADLTNALLNAGSLINPEVSEHNFEHSIEVELPILQYFLDDFTFIPLCCRNSSLNEYGLIARQIYEAVKATKDDVLIVASSDMTHYEADAAARKKDRFAIESILKFDEKRLLEKIGENNISMCGAAPISIMLILTKLLGATKAEVVLYQTSGDVTGDYSAVVGYLGAVIV